MTGYHMKLSPGYNGTASGTDAEIWQQLKTIVEHLCKNQIIVVEEAMRFGMSRTTAQQYTESYKTFDGTQTEDATLQVIEPLEGEESGEIMQLASGGGHERILKETIRRAFCRCVIFEMHLRGLEVNLIVA